MHDDKKREQIRIQSGLHAGKGLGDLVDDFTQITGIKAVTQIASQLTGESCGCAERRDALNDAVPNLPFS